MADWRLLKEQQAAADAEKMAGGDYSASGDFGDVPSFTPTMVGADDPFGAATSRVERPNLEQWADPGRMRRQRADAEGIAPYQPPPPNPSSWDSGMAMVGQAASAVGRQLGDLGSKAYHAQIPLPIPNTSEASNGMGFRPYSYWSLADVFEKGEPAMKAVEAVRGTAGGVVGSALDRAHQKLAPEHYAEATGTRAPVEQDFSPLTGGAKDVLNLGRQVGNLPPLQGGLSEQVDRMAAESGRPGLAIGSKVASFPGHIAPGIPNPFELPGAGLSSLVSKAGLPNPTLGEAASSFGKSLFEGGPRRGALGIPGIDPQSERLAKLAQSAAPELARSLRAPTEDVLQHMMVGGFVRGPNTALMSDEALLSAMKDYARKAVNEERPRGVQFEDAGRVSEESAQTAEERMLHSSPGTGERAPYAPRGESNADRAARLERVRESIDKGDFEGAKMELSALSKSQAVQLARKHGASGIDDKGPALDFLEKKFDEMAAKPTQPPTTPEGRQEAKELQAMQEAERIAAGGAPTKHPVTQLWEAGINQHTDPADIDRAVAALDGMTKTQIEQVAESIGHRWGAKPTKEGMIADLRQRLHTQRGDDWRSANADGSPPLNEAEKLAETGPYPEAPTDPAFALEQERARLQGPLDEMRNRGMDMEKPEIRRQQKQLDNVNASIRQIREAENGAATPSPSPAEHQPSIPNQPAPPQSPPVRPPEAPPPSANGKAGTPAASSPSVRNETGFAVNHIDSLQNAATRAKNPAGVKLAEDLREIVNEGTTKAAPIARDANAATQVALKDKVARKELAELVSPAQWREVGAGDLRVGKFQGFVDANAGQMGIDPAEVALQSPASLELAKVYLRGMEQTGREAEALGVTTPSGDPFVAQIDRFTQQIDPSAFGWMKPGDKTFEKLQHQLGLIYPDAEAKAIGAALQKLAANRLDRQAAFEFERLLPMTPAAIVDDAGQLRPILRYNPLPTTINPNSPVAGLFKSQWMRLSGIKRLGQDVAESVAAGPEGVDGLINGTKLGEALQAGGEDLVRAAEGAIGALYHRPEAGYTGAETQKWWINRSRSKFAQAFRAITGRVVPAMNLSRQGIVSSTQTLNEVPGMVGAIDFAKGLAQSIFKRGMSREDAEIAGAIHDKFLVAGQSVWDQHRPFESAVGTIVNRLPTEHLNDFVKDFNDTIAFTAGKFKGERMLENGAKLSDHLLMDEMNLPQSVQDVFRNPSAYDDAAKADAVNSFARSVSTESQFHGKNAALKGRFENDSVLRWVAPYQSYSINTLKRTAKDFERVWRTSGIGVDENANFVTRVLQRMNPFGAQKEPFRNSIQRLGTRLIGMELGGEAVADLSSGGQGKGFSRSDRSLLGRLLENMSYVGFLGPIHFLADMVGAHLLKESDPDLAKHMAQGRGGSRPVDLSNPALEATVKAASSLAQGEPGKALWDITGGQTPIVSSLGRASGVMEPAGVHHQAGESTTHNNAAGPFAGLGGKPSKAGGPFSGLGGGARRGGGPFSGLSGAKKSGPFSGLSGSR